MEKLNDMCTNCISLYSEDCTGVYTNIYTGCIYRKLPEMEKMQDNRKFKLALFHILYTVAAIIIVMI